MQRLVKVGHIPVMPVDGERVLDQVVGPDGEEISFLRQPVGNEGRGGGLHHNAHGESTAHRYPGPTELASA